MLSDIKSGRVSPILAYQQQVEAWLLQPAAKLAASRKKGETDQGIALFALELMFFEPHAQYLLGKTSDRASQRFFCQAFTEFLTFTANIGHPAPDGVTPTMFYRWARCGLFHSATLDEELLVDAVGFTRKWVERNPIHGGWLVNPWHLLPLIQQYLTHYVQSVQSAAPDAEVVQNFTKTFDRLIAEPLQALEARAQGHLGR